MKRKTQHGTTRLQRTCIQRAVHASQRVHLRIDLQHTRPPYIQINSCYTAIKTVVFRVGSDREQCHIGVQIAARGVSNSCAFHVNFRNSSGNARTKHIPVTVTVCDTFHDVVLNDNNAGEHNTTRASQTTRSETEAVGFDCSRTVKISLVPM